jgi:mRNA-degrading endonuclease RelE of RelBE toxin-antitoxin system
MAARVTPGRADARPSGKPVGGARICVHTCVHILRYEIDFDQEAVDELAALRPFDRVTILDAIEAALRHEPLTPSRHRKPVIPVDITVEAGITWELRVGDFRVYYDVDPPANVVVIRIVHKGRQTTEGSLT